MVMITLSKEEALVLAALLATMPDDANSLDLDDEINRQVIWNLKSLLEKELVEPFRDDYEELLANARENIRTSIGN